MLLWLSLLACEGGATEDSGCTDLRYESFGASVMTNHCTGCHSSQLEGSARWGAPPGVDLDSHGAVQGWSERILARSVGEGASMPPVGGPDADEQYRLEEWLNCGAP